MSHKETRPRREKVRHPPPRRNFHQPPLDSGLRNIITGGGLPRQTTRPCQPLACPLGKLFELAKKEELLTCMQTR